MNHQWVVCAAIKYNDRIIAGPRHFDSIMRGQFELNGPRVHWEQGFIDQHGQFLTRFEAFVVAKRNGQLKENAYGTATLDGVELFSEDLY